MQQIAELKQWGQGGIRLPWMLVFSVLISGCATPVGVKPVDIQAAYAIQTESALSAEQPSEPSKTVLRRLGLMDRFETEPAKVLAELHRGLSPADDDDRLFALAELSFLHADRAHDRAYFLASAVYAWALLFPDGTGTQLRPSDPRYRLAYDLYNQALAKGLKTARGKGDANDEMQLASGTHKLPFGTLRIDLDPTGMTWGGYRLGHFVPTTTLEVRGLRNRYNRHGIGAPLAASIETGPTATKAPGSERLGARIKVPVTALLRLDHPRAHLAEGRIEGRLEVHAADEATTVKIDGQDLPLESDPTAALAYQLEGSELYAMEIAAFMRGGIFRDLIPRSRAQDGLFLLHPYKPGKIPVALVHGTASSPARWAELVNELEGDPRIRERFQIWVFTYDSGNPIGYSASRLRAAMSATVQELDPQGADAALRRMVVIGHSQGGLLTKLTSIDSGDHFWKIFSDKPLDALKLDAKAKADIKDYAFYTPMPFVERVIFVATPHRGALLAGGRIGAIAASLVTLPVNLLSTVTTNIALSGEERLVRHLNHPPTAVDNMNPENPALKILGTLPVDPRIKAHSIIAVKGDGPKEEGNDGVVAYKSAHIDEALTEKVVRWDHSCQGQPEVIEEIRRILYEHAGLAGEQRP
jgi:pimeloyl-ACP methyl ester carboxylesterase